MGDNSMPAVWNDALLAAALLAVDTFGLGGVSVRARPGPVRDAWLEDFTENLGATSALKRLPVNITEGRLLGGLDLTATLNAGRPIAERGLLAEANGGVIVAAMAERMTPSTAAHIAAAMDAGEITVERDGLGLIAPARFGIIALDEGIEAEEYPPHALLDRLAFHLDLTHVRLNDLVSSDADGVDIDAARQMLPSVEASGAAIETLCAAAMALGIGSVRAAHLALKAARANAALNERQTVDDEDLLAAARLVLAPRATQLPMDELPDEESAQEDSSSDPDPPPSEQSEDMPLDDKPLEDRVVEAAAASIPPGLLFRLKALAERARQSASGGKAGDIQKGRGRGRPAGTLRGQPKAGVRLNVVETLRAAAPWQPIRRKAANGSRGEKRRVDVRPDDFRITRLKQRRRTVTIFVVDASGSAALHRLAEAKGAVELLLAECYVRRDEVALIAFRGTGAELLLPPTRSLARARRSLAGLPGGGGTPLAHAIDAAAALADAVKRKGQTPSLVFLSDGGANVARDGTGGRGKAREDAMNAARRLKLAGMRALFVDTAPRPKDAAEHIACEMDAVYLPLPQADAAAISQAAQMNMAA